MDLSVTDTANRDEIRQGVGFVGTIGIEMGDVMNLQVSGATTNLAGVAIALPGSFTLGPPRSAVVGVSVSCAQRIMDEGVSTLTATKAPSPFLVRYFEYLFTMLAGFLEQVWSWLLSTGRGTEATPLGNTRTWRSKIFESVIAIRGSASFCNLGLDMGCIYTLPGTILLFHPALKLNATRLTNVQVPLTARVHAVIRAVLLPVAFIFDSTMFTRFQHSLIISHIV